MALTLTFLCTTTCLVKTSCIVGCNSSTRQKDIGILEAPPVRYEAKKRIDEVAKSEVLNESSLEPTKFYVIKCPRINLN